MDMQNVNYTEDNADDFYDWVQGLRICPDISYIFTAELSEGFSGGLVVDDLGIDGGKSIVIRTKSIGFKNPICDTVTMSNEIWAIKVGNGYLVTDPIEFSF